MSGNVVRPISEEIIMEEKLFIWLDYRRDDSKFKDVFDHFWAEADVKTKRKMMEILNG